MNIKPRKIMCSLAILIGALASTTAYGGDYIHDDFFKCQDESSAIYRRKEAAARVTYQNSLRNPVNQNLVIIRALGDAACLLGGNLHLGNVGRFAKPLQIFNMGAGLVCGFVTTEVVTNLIKDQALVTLNATLKTLEAQRDYRSNNSNGKCVKELESALYNAAALGHPAARPPSTPLLSKYCAYGICFTESELGDIDNFLWNAEREATAPPAPTSGFPAGINPIIVSGSRVNQHSY